MKEKDSFKYSELHNFNDLKVKLEKFGTANMFFWLFDRLISGIISNDGKIVWSDTKISENQIWDNLIESRIFNKEKEIYCRKVGNKIYYRIKDDTKGLKEYKDIHNYLIGTRSKLSEDHFTILFDDKGTSLPIPGIFNNIRVSEPLKLTIRNYIGFNNRGMAGFVDARFVEIKH